MGVNQAVLDRRTAQEAPQVAFWEGALGYPHAILVALTAIALGGFFHRYVGYELMPAPLTFIFGSVAGTCGVWYVARRFRTDRVVGWLCGIPFAVVVTSLAVLLSMVGGYMSQERFHELFGVPTMFGTWPFIFIVILLQLNLIGSTARRAWPLTRSNAQYLLMHGGLALSLFGGAYGAVGLERTLAVCFYGMATDVAYHRDGSEVKMPFELTLSEFKMERFPPVLALATLDESAKDGMAITAGSNFVADGMRETIGSYRLRVEQFLPRSAMLGDRYVEYLEKTSAPAALVVLEDAQGKEVKRGWVSSGGLESPGSLLAVDEGSAIVMPEPRPKKFRSELTILQDEKKKSISVEVNAPYNVGPYRLYQLSYDDKMGEASHYSVIEVVRDRSVPVVYAGMIALLLGVAMMMWQGVNSPMKGKQ
jgi:hypothetical protein